MNQRYLSCVTGIDSPDDLATVLAASRSLLFCRVSWSIYSFQSRAVVVTLIERMTMDRLDAVAHCFVADVSNEHGPLWIVLHTWLAAEMQPAEQLLMTGGGALIWLCDGKVAASCIAAHQLGIAKIMAITRRVFGDHDAIP